ncbi:EGF-like domain-containing protein [Heterostelium album PN500]|uniref:EGF-like domain-containing protein n=1 Tax=Heterostelium pallidum (strain ATCC 26659 / Pp 5 / PN500) TaxID=670386 RepID=D3B9W2_HETP5|nr:EGF-like domain-containing protein [Heterostelium album PN500]EFA81349.1 EGF-like domain-containing protein [Heterostelium album PN500]|eukprot:XP_020433467.1 EGF-like domain-containing protein [Heterostelium album PN500]
MYKTNILFIIWLVTISTFIGVSHSSDLNPNELNSIRWLISQYQLQWSITATNCADIVGTTFFGTLTCSDNGVEESIQKINVRAGKTVDSGEPVYIEKLTFPLLTDFSFQTYSPAKNSSYNILTLLDNDAHVYLTNLLIYNININVTNTFPSKLPALNQLSFYNTIVYSDISLNNIFQISNIGVIDFSNLTFTSTYQLILSSNDTINSNIGTIGVADTPAFQTYGGLNITSTYFPSLTTLKLRYLTPEPVTLFNADRLNTVSFETANVTFGKLPALDSVELIKSTSSVSDFSIYYVTKLTLRNSYTPLTGASGLTLLSASNTFVPVIPPENWFAPTFTLLLSNTNTTGYLPEYPINSGTVSITGSQYNISVKLYESYCYMNLIFLPSTLLVDFDNIAECFYCYYPEIKANLPPNTPAPPSNYTCNYSIKQKAFPKLYPNGRNLGWGQNLAPKELTKDQNNRMYILRTRESFGKLTIYFSTTHNYAVDILWGMQLVVQYVHSINLDSGDMMLRFTGTFNTFAPMIITLENMAGPKCIVSTKSQTQLECIVSNYSTLAPVWVNISDTISNVTMYTSPPLIISEVKPNGNGFLTFVGNYGPAPYQVSVMFPTLFYPYSLTSTELIIYTAQKLIPNTNYTAQVLANGYTVNVTFSIPKIIKNDCGPNDNCYGHGNCSDICSCFSGYGGYYCELQLNPGVVILPNNTTPSPTIIVQNGLNFTFNIVAIQELDSLASVAKEILTTNWTVITLGDGNFSKTIYSLDPAIAPGVIAIIEYSKEMRVVEFAGQTTTYPENSLKLLVSITNWKYSDKLNHLRVILSTSATINSDCAQIDITVNNSTSVDYLKMTFDGQSLYGRFLPYGLADGVPALVTNHVVNQTKDAVLVGMTLPYCQACVIDPDFSVLIESGKKDKATCGGGDEKFAAWKIATIAVVCGVALAAAAITTAIVMKNKFKYRTEKTRVESKLSRI